MVLHMRICAGGPNMAFQSRSIEDGTREARHVMDC